MDTSFQRDVLQFRKAWENMKRARRTSLDRERALKLLSQHPICLLANTDDEMFNPDDIEELDSHDSDWVYQNRLTKKTEALTTDAESHTSLPENIQGKSIVWTVGLLTCEYFFIVVNFTLMFWRYSKNSRKNVSCIYKSDLV